MIPLMKPTFSYFLILTLALVQIAAREGMAPGLFRASGVNASPEGFGVGEGGQQDPEQAGAPEDPEEDRREGRDKRIENEEEGEEERKEDDASTAALKQRASVKPSLRSTTKKADFAAFTVVLCN